MDKEIQDSAANNTKETGHLRLFSKLMEKPDYYKKKMRRVLLYGTSGTIEKAAKYSMGKIKISETRINQNVSTIHNIIADLMSYIFHATI